MDEFEPGEILITCFTDTAWTPLFNLATAVVVEIGSLLSHSSIVARELGIPAVVNTKVATQVIRTGDTLVVDGNEGKVYLQSQSHP
jgi:pyruvate,water dikinase